MLTAREFDYLADIHNALARDPAAPVLDAEWSDVYAILVQRLKRGMFQSWRAEEQAVVVNSSTLGLTLTTAFFRLRPSPLTGGTEAELRPWRGSVAARRAWEDTLQARSDQAQAVRDGMRSAVDAAEEATLPRLRDELVFQLAGASGQAGADLGVQTPADRRWRGRLPAGRHASPRPSKPSRGCSSERATACSRTTT